MGETCAFEAADLRVASAFEARTEEKEEDDDIRYISRENQLLMDTHTAVYAFVS
jgi:hypothetical protein